MSAGNWKPMTSSPARKERTLMLSIISPKKPLMSPAANQRYRAAGPARDGVLTSSIRYRERSSSSTPNVRRFRAGARARRPGLEGCCGRPGTRARIAWFQHVPYRRPTMRPRLFVPAAVFLAVLVIGPVQPAAQAPRRVPVDCNRACLEGLIDQYLAALVAHDPKRLPLSADVKYTENDQVLDVGDGFWNTVTGRGNYNHYFADPVENQAGWMGTMRERNALLLMTLRLRV